MQPLGQVLPRVLSEVVRNAPLSAGKVDFAWKSAVGPAIGRASAVLLEDGILLVDTQSAQWASAIQGSTRIILSRLQALLGDDVVREIRLRR